MNMRFAASTLIAAMISSLGIFMTANAALAEDAGETKFKQHCAVCHPGGSNIINPTKTLHKKDREANKIKTASDIMNLVRHPGPGMTQFDEKTLSSKDAHEIAEYIIKTFN